MDEDEEMLNDRLYDILGWLTMKQITQKLPPEIWERIFLHLRAPNELLSVRLVCHHWRNIVDRCPFLIEQIKLKFPRSLTVDERYVPVHPFPARKVKFSTANIRTLGSWWPTVGQRLTDLKLHSCTVAFMALIRMLRGTPNLRRFRMIGGCCTGLRTNSVIDFRLDQLERLTLEWPSHASEPEVVDILRRAGPPLKIFRFLGPTRRAGLEDRVIQLLRDVQGSLECVELSMLSSNTLLKELCTMERLQLKVVILSSKDFPVDQRVLVELCRAQPTIEALEMSCCQVTNETFCEIGEALPGLKSVKIVVNFPHERPMVVPTFLSFMSGLEYLSLKVSYNSSESQLIDFGPCRVPNLKELLMTGIRPTADGLRQFFNTSANIRKLSLTRCHLNSWSDLFSSSHLKCLQKLELQRTSVTNDPDGLVLEPLASLKHLKFDDGSRTSKPLVMKLLSLCPHLERFYLCGRIVHLKSR